MRLVDKGILYESSMPNSMYRVEKLLNGNNNDTGKTWRLDQKVWLGSREMMLGTSTTHLMKRSFELLLRPATTYSLCAPALVECYFIVRTHRTVSL